MRKLNYQENCEVEHFHFCEKSWRGDLWRNPSFLFLLKMKIILKNFQISFLQKFIFEKGFKNGNLVLFYWRKFLTWTFCNDVNPFFVDPQLFNSWHILLSAKRYERRNCKRKLDHTNRKRKCRWCAKDHTVEGRKVRR